MKKILTIIISIFAIGIVLSLSLPDFKSSALEADKKQSYTVDQASLFTPLPMKNFLLITPLPTDAEFTLQLGLYSELQQAVIKIKEFTVEKLEREKLTLPEPLSETLRIVKTTDGKREWYFILLGQYKTMDQAEQQKRWLQNKQISATLMLFPKDLMP